MTTRFGATDVHYPPSGGGHAALVASCEPEFTSISERRTTWLDDVADPTGQPGLGWHVWDAGIAPRVIGV